MAINGTTLSQCFIMAIWFINYPLQWGFYLTHHANWQRRHTDSYTETSRRRAIFDITGRLVFPLCCGTMWLGRFMWMNAWKTVWQFGRVKTHTVAQKWLTSSTPMIQSSFFFFFRWRGHGLVMWLNIARFLLQHGGKWHHSDKGV